MGGEIKRSIRVFGCLWHNEAVSLCVLIVEGHLQCQEQHFEDGLGTWLRQPVQVNAGRPA